MSDVSDVSGKSVLDLLWEKLDEYVWAVQAIVQERDRGHDGDDQAFAEVRGRAHGCAMALALVLNPYAPDLAAVKEEAMVRWENAHDEPEPVDPVRAARLARRAARHARRAARNA